MKTLLSLTFCLLSVSFLGGCGQTRPAPLPTVPQVDLPAFMGDWYVIASIPTFMERGAHNAVESYRLDTDGSIATTFTFRKGAFDGPEKRLTPRGFVRKDSGNAVWGMRFFWPFQADFRIVHLSKAGDITVVARERRDHVWIMARRPQIPETDYQSLVRMVEGMGYDSSLIQKVPQKWP